MFKTLWAYLLGFVAGFLVLMQIIEGSSVAVIISIFIVVITLVLAELVNLHIHKKMKNKHDELFKNGKY